MPKTVLLGLDGATFEMLDPMLETGELPVLNRLLRSGARDDSAGALGRGLRA